MAECFGAGQPAVDRMRHHLHHPVGRPVQVVVEAQHTGDVNVDMLGHRCDGERVGGELDHGLDRVADDIALSGGEQVQHRAGCAAKRDHLGSRAGRVHKMQPGGFGRFGRLQEGDDRAAAHLFDISERLLFDRRETAADVAFSRLGAEQADTLGSDQLLVVVEGGLELGGDLRRGALLDDLVFRAGYFGGLAEDQGVADSSRGAQTRARPWGCLQDRWSCPIHRIWSKPRSRPS